MWTVNSIVFPSPQTGSDNDSPDSQLSQATDWEQAESPSRTLRKMVKSSKKTLSCCRRKTEESVTEVTDLKKQLFKKDKPVGKDVAAWNSYQVSNRLKNKWQTLRCVPQWGKKLSISPSAHKEKEGRKMGRNPLCPRSQRTRTGVWTRSCWPCGRRRNSSVLVVPTSNAEDQGKTQHLASALVPSHTRLCHPPVWELESTSDPKVCCTCGSLLTK